MLEALIRGKLSPEQENMEDVLTSCVFGTFKLIQPIAGLFPFLAQAVPWRDEPNQLEKLRNLHEVMSIDVEYSFWPLLHYPERHRCEPDVVVRVTPTNQLILIEAKLRSGKSTEADDSPWPFDQLAREWDNLLRLANGCEPILVFLTSDVCIPSESIEASVNEFERKRPNSPSPNIYWLAWQQLSKLDLDAGGTIEHLKDVLDRLDLLPFTGFGPVAPVPRYTFGVLPPMFDWDSYDHWPEAVWAFNNGNN